MLADEPELGEALLGDGPAFDPAVAAAAGIGPADVASGCDGAATMASLLAECSDIGPPLPPPPTTVPPPPTVASSLPPAPPLEVAAAAAASASSRRELRLGTLEVKKDKPPLSEALPFLKKHAGRRKNKNAQSKGGSTRQPTVSSWADRIALQAKLPPTASPAASVCVPAPVLAPVPAPVLAPVPALAPMPVPAPSPALPEHGRDDAARSGRLVVREYHLRVTSMAIGTPD
jgi:hypothetical protein